MTAKSAIAALIPARYDSTRFPGKALAKICGVTMIERVYKQATKAKSVGRVMVATDDERIYEAVKSFGGEAIMTKKDHINGTERLAEVAERFSEIEIIVNVQGDEPLIDPDAIDATIAPLLKDNSIEMSTIARKISDPKEVESNQVNKVVFDSKNMALYFSRLPIPFYRDGRDLSQRNYYAHIGLYVYRRDCLLKLAKLKPTPLELAESLEQLRALENGIGINVVEFQTFSLGVDIPEDVTKVEAALKLLEKNASTNDVLTHR